MSPDGSLAFAAVVLFRNFGRAAGASLLQVGWALMRIGIPLAQLCNEHFSGARERVLLKNIAYLGALTALLDVDMAVVEALLQETYGRKKALLDSNFTAIRLGHDYAREHCECPLPIRLEPRELTSNHILIDGNTAAAHVACAWMTGHSRRGSRWLRFVCSRIESNAAPNTSFWRWSNAPLPIRTGRAPA